MGRSFEPEYYQNPKPSRAINYHYITNYSLYSKLYCQSLSLGTLEPEYLEPFVCVCVATLSHTRTLEPEYLEPFVCVCVATLSHTRTLEPEYLEPFAPKLFPLSLFSEFSRCRSLNYTHTHTHTHTFTHTHTHTHTHTRVRGCMST